MSETTTTIRWGVQKCLGDRWMLVSQRYYDAESDARAALSRLRRIMRKTQLRLVRAEFIVTTDIVETVIDE